MKLPFTLKSAKITSRDQALFKYLFFNKVATAAQIRRDLFGLVSRQAVSRRLLLLVRRHYLLAQSISGERRELVYSLTDQTLREVLGVRFDLKKKQKKSSSILHDLTLIEIQMALKRLKSVIAYYPENAIQSGALDSIEEVRSLKSLRSDAILKMNYQGQELFLPLEYEASLKFQKRLQKRIREYYRNENLQASIFIGKEEALRRKLAQTEKKMGYSKNPKLFYQTLSNVIGHTGIIQLRNSNSEKLILN